MQTPWWCWLFSDMVDCRCALGASRWTMSANLITTAHSKYDTDGNQACRIGKFNFLLMIRYDCSGRRNFATSAVSKTKKSVLYHSSVCTFISLTINVLFSYVSALNMHSPGTKIKDTFRNFQMMTKHSIKACRTDEKQNATSVVKWFPWYKSLPQLYWATDPSSSHRTLTSACFKPVHCWIKWLAKIQQISWVRIILLLWPESENILMVSY